MTDREIMISAIEILLKEAERESLAGDMNENDSFDDAAYLCRKRSLMYSRAAECLGKTESIRHRQHKVYAT